MPDAIEQLRHDLATALAAAKEQHRLCVNLQKADRQRDRVANRQNERIVRKLKHFGEEIKRARHD